MKKSGRFIKKEQILHEFPKGKTRGKQVPRESHM